MSECSACPSGRWSSSAGASLCTACSPGKYGLGSAECQACRKGSYNTEEGSSSCVLCAPGRFNPLPFSSADCLKCEVGRFSSVLGAQTEDSCIHCDEGITTLTPGAIDRSMCIQPARENFTAVAGRQFSIEITGNRLQAAQHQVAIATASGSIVPSVISADGIVYEWQEPLALNGGVYELLWCAGIHGACRASPDFAFHLGLLEIAGPALASFTCVRGRSCEGLGPVSGVDLQTYDRIQLQGSCGSGPAIATTLQNPSGAVFDIFVDGAGDMTLGFGPEPISTNPAMAPAAYSLCWCAMARGQSGGCVTERDFLVRMGGLRVEGPYSGQERSCHLGQHCHLDALQGLGISLGDRIIVMDRCGATGQSVVGMPGGGIAESEGTGEFKFLPLLPAESPKLLLSVPGLFRLCFCRPMPGQNCTAPGDFVADTGFFTAKGPRSDQEFGCLVGRQCVLMGMAGVGIEDGDEVAVQASWAPGACEDSGNERREALTSGLQSTRAVASNKGGSFSLGLLHASGIPGKHRLCWRPRGSAEIFRTDVGLFFIACPGGMYRLTSLSGVECVDCPIGFYCPGGTSTGLFQDDIKIVCREGSTTLTNRSSTSGDCLCSSGFYKQASDCVQCPAGRVKPLIADSDSCPLECPMNTTSQLGAHRLELCYPNAASTGAPGLATKKETAEIFVVRGEVVIPTCLDKAVLAAVKLQLKRSIARALTVQLSEVNLSLPELPDSGCREGRRLQASQQPLMYSVPRSRQEEAARMTQNINFLELQAEMKEKVGIVVAIGAAPVIVVELLNCSAESVSLSFPLGSQPTSLAECKCAPGYGIGEVPGLCQRCAVSQYKDKAADKPCTPCGSAPDSGGGRDVRLITLESGASAEQFCTCPQGYYAAQGVGFPPLKCEPCDLGYYCVGGREKTICPSGTTTLLRASESIDDCVCTAGWEPLQVQLASERCKPCDRGFFKSGVGNTDCEQKCPPNSMSEPGAVTARDCFCSENFYWRPERSSTGNSTGRCLACPEEGVYCPGGFEPADSRKHVEPQSLEGYYMTGLAEAEQCFIEDEDGESVCLPGFTAANSSSACGGLQTGVLCGACLHRSARDLGDEACEDCEDFPAWVHVGNLHLDLLLKAAFGMFLGKQAMDSSTKSRKMEAVIIRIVLHWVTACSVLTLMDLSSVEVFGWSKDSVEAAASKASESATGGGSIEAAATATGVSMKFQFPEWFKPLWKAMMFLSGSIPGPISPQFSIECLTQAQLPSSSLPSLRQLLVPALWWFFYPISVTISVVVCCLLLAKVFYPLAQWFALRAKKKVSKRLVQLGVSERTAQRALMNMDAERVKGLMDDPVALTSEQGVAEGFGGEVYAEVAASFLVQSASCELKDMVRELVERNAANELVERNAANEHIVAAARHLLDEPVESKDLLQTFLVRVLRSIDAEKLPNLFDDPTSVPPLLLEHLEGLSESDALIAFQPGAEEGGIEGPEQRDAGLGRLSRAADCADEEEFGEQAVGAKDFTKNFHIFGLFRSTNFRDVLVDAFPLYIVTWYSIWDLVTQRMLGLVQVQTVLMLQSRDADGLEQMSVERRWFYDMRFQRFQGGHIVVGIIGLLGLLVWSVVLLLALILKLTRNKYSLQEVSFMRNYGYFYNGLDPNAFWWEVMVKKFDILVIYTVTFTEIFVDPKSKLTMYLGLAGLFWAAHNHYRPYDDRQNRLADRLEDLGLTARFGSLFFIQILLMINAPPRINAIVAFFLIVTNAWFIVTAVFLLVIELPNMEVMATDARKAKQAQDAVHERTTGKAADMFSFGENPFTQLLSFLMNIAVTKIIAPVVRMVLRVFAIMARTKERAAGKVPHMQWQGVGLDIVVATHVEEQLPCLERIFAAFVRRLYRLGDMEQKVFLSNSIGQFWDYVLNNSECHQLPSCIMDIFFVLPKAIQKEKEEMRPDMTVEFHIRVAQRIRKALLCSRPSREAMRSSMNQRATGMSRRNTFQRSKAGADLMEYSCNGEDLTAALLFLQRLPKTDVHEFLLEALVDAPQLRQALSI